METKINRGSIKMKKIIWPLGNVLRFIFGILFLIVVVIDIILIKTYLLALVIFIIGCLMILRGMQFIILNNNQICVTMHISTVKIIQYKESIDINNICKIEQNYKGTNYSSRGIKKYRGFNPRLPFKFIELFLYDSSVKRIYADDLSKKQINKILEYIISKNKNVEIKKD